MKRNIIKVLILVVVLALGLGGILRYKHTKIDPPMSFVFCNVHNEYLSQIINEMDEKSLENQYANMMFMLRRYREENLIGIDTLDMRLEDAIAKYTPFFISRCDRAFSSNIWDTPPWNHSFMIARISELKKMRTSKYKVIISNSSNFITELNEIETTIERYNRAREIARNTSFISLNNTKERVKEAIDLKTDDKLKNCWILVQELNNLPQAIQQSHLRYLQSELDKLSCNDFDSYETYYRDLQKLYNDNIQEYVSFYGNEDGINQLKQRVLSNQYNVLDNLVSYAINIYNFNRYDDYQDVNNKVYEYINNYFGNTLQKKTLQDKLRNGTISRSSFIYKKY